MDTAFFSGGSAVEYVLLLGGMILLTFVIPAFIRRSMKVDKSEWNSFLYINSIHKKGELTLRTVYIAAVIIGFMLTKSLLFLVGLLGVSTLLERGFQAYIEWKYIENPSSCRASLYHIACIGSAFIYVILWLQVSPTFA